MTSNPTRWVLARGHRFNERVGEAVANWLSAMWFFWLAILLACLSLPAIVAQVDEHVLHAGVHGVFPEWLIDSSVIGLVAWVAQTLIQLAALPVLAYQAKKAEGQQQEQTRTLMAHTEAIIAALDLSIEGGLESVYKILVELRDEVKRSR